MKAPNCWQFKHLRSLPKTRRECTPFSAQPGLSPTQIRAAARQDGFLAGVLEHILDNESLLVAFADSAGIDPAEIARARVALGRGADWERDLP